MRRVSLILSIILIVVCFLSSTCIPAEIPASPEITIRSLEMVIPDYTVTTIGDLDYVEIPEGEILIAEEGRPQVPYYIKSIDYPEGYRVQNVILKEKSGLATTTGLRLSVVILDPYPELPVEMIKGWYPEKNYDWRLWDNTDGSTLLVITVYPFYYNPETTEVKFYKDYHFDIEHVVSNVAITSLTLGQDFYQPGDKVSINIGLNNSAAAQDIVVSTVIMQYGSSEILSGLPLRLLRDLVGDASVSVDWETSGVEAGYYCAEVTLTDTAGIVLDNERLGFPLEVYETPE